MVFIRAGRHRLNRADIIRTESITDDPSRDYGTPLKVVMREGEALTLPPDEGDEVRAGIDREKKECEGPLFGKPMAVGPSKNTPGEGQ